MVSFGCTRCGACCNSAPQLSLPELFRHQDRFIGCLSLRRVDSLEPGTSFNGSTRLALEDCRAFDAWVVQYLHQASGVNGTVFVSLTSQAYDDPALNRCPALTPENLCALEGENKPQGCRAVPLDPILPDSLQHHLLRSRASEAAYMGAHCISFGESSSPSLLVSGATIADIGAKRTLEARREALLLDKQLWGKAVFEMLLPELFAHPQRVSNLPTRDYFSLSLAPALSALCVVSQRVRTRVVEYLTAQIELLAAVLYESPQKSSSVEQTLIGFFRANLALRAALQRGKDDRDETSDARRVEAWLGIAS